MEQKRPRGRDKYVTGGGGNLHRRGEGLGSGPVGQSDGYSGRKGSSGRSSGGLRSGGRMNPLMLIILVIAMLGGGGGALSGLLGGGSSDSGSSSTGQYQSSYGSGYTATGGSGTSASAISQFFGGNGDTSTGWSSSNTSAAGLNTDVASGSRSKRTVIKGNGQDQITIMVYMCGTDLESKSGMATSDLQEMLNAKTGDRINLLVFTGGCKSWRNSTVSSSVNQIYQIKNGSLNCLVSNAGTAAMTDPSNLSGFIKWCATNFPANRNELIFWDHGGGSISGYGYDEKNATAGSMGLTGINKALKDGGVTFDFIGFDACLMATMENGLMLNSYGDYLIASEETEPGVGWYYTNWLTDLAGNTSMPTIEIGQEIADDFVDVCAKKCPGQQTTLSVVDLAELSNTVPDKLTSFSESISSMIRDKEYAEVSTARNNTREFAKTSRIDQIDLVHLAENMGTDEGKALSEVLKGAVKYNRTSDNMTNAYGVSIYFPYQRTSYVDAAVKTYDTIGMDESYTKCIQEFASLEASGQVAAGGSAAASPLGSLLGGSYAGGSSSYGNTDALSSLLGAFLGGNTSPLSGLASADFLSGRSMNADEMAGYIEENHLDPENLKFEQDSDGNSLLKLTEAEWKLVHSLDKNVFYDDGEGYIDLGLDNVYSFNEDGDMIADTSGTWLAINGQSVAYYHLNTEDDGTNYTITGRVPVLLNGEAANLILVFDNDNPRGYIAGASYAYANQETETQAKNLVELSEGDTLDFVADYYSYDGTYQDSYMIGDQMTVSGDMQISDVRIGDGSEKITYRLTDIYNQEYWTDAIDQ